MAALEVVLAECSLQSPALAFHRLSCQSLFGCSGREIVEAKKGQQADSDDEQNVGRNVEDMGPLRPTVPIVNSRMILCLLLGVDDVPGPLACVLTCQERSQYRNQAHDQHEP